MKPTFKNRKNECIIQDGKEYYISRSVAVIGCITIVVDGKGYVLAEKRSEIMDQPFKWCLPCGYLDWDENASSALIREVYEETGIYLHDLNDSLIFESLGEPFKTKTEPTDEKQNITFKFGAEYELKDFIDLSKHKCPEVIESRWILLSDIPHYEWAFNHEELIKDWYKYMSSNA